MIPRRQFSGFLSFDALFSVIPLLLMVLLLIQTISQLTSESESFVHKQQKFDKLVSIADYTVNTGAVERDTDVRYPNWVDANKLDANYVESLRKRAGFSTLYLSLDTPDPSNSICIYRIVVVGDQKEIKKLYVCGT